VERAEVDADNQDTPDADNQDTLDAADNPATPDADNQDPTENLPSGRGSDEEQELRETVQTWLKHAQEDAYVCELPSRPLVNSQPHCSQGCGQVREVTPSGDMPWVADWDKFAPPPPEAGWLAAIGAPSGESIPDIYTTSFLV